LDVQEKPDSFVNFPAKVLIPKAHFLRKFRDEVHNITAELRKQRYAKRTGRDRIKCP